MSENFFRLLARELKLKQEQIKGTVELLDEGNTVPFIARYRKEATGGLDEVQIRSVEERIGYLRNLEDRKAEVIRLIADRDKLTAELEEKIREAEVLQEVEDLYRPYRPRRQTRATRAREKGLEPLARLIWQQELLEGSPELLAREYINPEFELEEVGEILQGARDIVAEWVADDAEIRKKVRQLSYQQGQLVSSLRDKELDQAGKYEMYYDYLERVKGLPPHRTLALNRGEQEEVLQVRVKAPEEEILRVIRAAVLKNKESIFLAELTTALDDAYKRLIAPSIEREIRKRLTTAAGEHAIEIFTRNLRSLLLQPPLKGQVVIGIDPGFRTGSKVCVVDQTGKLLDTATIYPHPPQNRTAEAGERVRVLIEQYGVRAIAIGNGTASRETEFFIAGAIKGLAGGVRYTIVSEAGASVYSASDIAREEFPRLDVAMRGAVSIARRLQDPLAELVKIEPRAIGVGLYQHDINPGRLEESLQKVVESVVNYVGVDLNTASPSLLQYVAGINSTVARNIVQYREENGLFQTREELKKVSRLGEKTFTQAAGFLRINRGRDNLAMTPIHPESYGVAASLLRDLGFSPADIRSSERLNELRGSFAGLDLREKAAGLKVGLPTLLDIVSALKQPGRDPRDELPAPLFRTDVLKMEDLRPEMILQGTVRNVVDFGAFVDIGVKEDGLVHISELSSQYVQNPLDIVQVGDTVEVKVLKVDERRKRISLSMKI